MRNPVLFGILLVLTILIMIYEPALAFGDSSSDTMQQKSENVQNLHFPYNQICAPGIYPGKICVIDGKAQPYLKPPYQKYAGISVDNVICAEGKKLMLKSHDLSPICVDSTSVEKLGQRGWDLSSNKQKTILSSKIVSDQNLSHSVRLDVKSEVIGNDNYLIFEGSGWHNFHSVEITISNNGKELASIRSKTNDNGVLYVPWSLSVAGLPNGLYTIFATDGIHQKSLNFLFL